MLKRLATTGLIAALLSSGATVVLSLPSAEAAGTGRTRLTGTLLIAHGDTLDPKEAAANEPMDADGHADHDHAGHDHASHDHNTPSGVANGHDLLIKAVRLPNGKTINLRGNVPEALAGKEISVTGLRAGDALDVESVALASTTSGTTSTTGGTAPTLAAPLSTRTAAVLMISLADGPTWASVSSVGTFADIKTQTEAAMFGTGVGSVRDFARETSDGRMEFTGSVFGEIRLTDSQVGCKWQTWETNAKTAAANAGITLANYSDLVVIWPYTSQCGFAGVGYVGTKGAFINMRSIGVIAHELGHNWSVGHAASMRCTDAMGAPVTISPSCTFDEYGDVFSDMGGIDYAGGGSPPARLHHAQQQSQISSYVGGGLPLGSQQEVKTSGTYTFARRHQGATPEQLRIPRGILGNSFDLEMRSTYGQFDTFASTDPGVNGVMVRMQSNDITSSARSYLLDANPSTATFTDAPFSVGKGFTDPITGISATMNTITATNATVQVVVPVDTQAPSALSGLTVTPGPAGADLAWKASTDNVYPLYRVAYQVAGSSTTPYSYTTGSTTTSLGGLAQGTTYTVTVTPFDAAGNNGASQSATFTTLTDTQPPTVPTNVTATAVSVHQVNLTWGPATDNFGLSYYTLYYDGAYLKDVLPSTLSCTITDGTVSSAGCQSWKLTAGTHTFGVQAVDGVGLRSPIVSTTVTVGNSDTIAPSAPGNPVASNVTTNGATITWAPATDNVGVTGYDVYLNGTFKYSLSATATTLSSLLPGTTYTVAIDAFDAAANVSAKTSVTFTTANLPTGDLTPPSTVSNLAAGQITNTSATLSWGAASDNVGVTGYRIVVNGLTSTTNTTSFTVTGLAAGTTYMATVNAFDAAGNQGPTTAVTFTTTNLDTTPPSAVTNLAAGSITTGSATLAWTAASDNVGVTGYRVTYAPSGSPSNTITGTTTTTSALLSGLSAGTSYTATVTAFDGAGNLGVATSVTFTTGSIITTDTQAPSAVTGLTGSVSKSRTVTLSWLPATDNVGVTGYLVFRDGIQVMSTTATVARRAKEPRGTHTYTVYAFDAAGNRSPGASVTLTM